MMCQHHPRLKEYSPKQNRQKSLPSCLLHSGRGRQTIHKMSFRLWTVTAMPSLWLPCRVLIEFHDAFKSKLSCPVSVLRETVTPSIALGSDQRCCAGSMTFTGRLDPSLDPWVPFHHREGLSGSQGLSRTASAAFPGWVLMPPIFSSFQTQKQPT